MMIDKLAELCDATALSTAGTATYLTGDVVDLGTVPTLQNIGGGDPLYLIIQVDTDVTSAGAATVQFLLSSSSTSDLATTPTDHNATAVIPKATLTAGYTMCLPLPGSITCKRYMGLRAVIATAALTAGKINAFITADPGHWVAYTDFV